jgi:hypothetical protein
MKVSELIEQLQNALSHYGDRRILVDYCAPGEITELKVYNTGEICLNINTREKVF